MTMGFKSMTHRINCIDVSQSQVCLIPDSSFSNSDSVKLSRQELGLTNVTPSTLGFKNI